MRAVKLTTSTRMKATAMTESATAKYRITETIAMTTSTHCEKVNFVIGWDLVLNYIILSR